MAIRDEVVDILSEKAASIFGGEPSDYNADTSFEDDLHCRSANYVQLSAALEDEYEVEVPYMEFRKLKTFGEAGDWMGEKFGE